MPKKINTQRLNFTKRASHKNAKQLSWKYFKIHEGIYKKFFNDIQIASEQLIDVKSQKFKSNNSTNDPENTSSV